jgi:hypothetical protein
MYDDLPVGILDKIQSIMYHHYMNKWILISWQRKKYSNYENDQCLYLGFEKSDKLRYLRISYYGDVKVLPGGLDTK